MGLYGWLKNQKCAFRAFLQISSAGGSIYCAQMADKVARAWIEHGQGDQLVLVKAVLARHDVTRKTDSAGSSQRDVPTQGLW